MPQFADLRDRLGSHDQNRYCPQPRLSRSFHCENQITRLSNAGHSFVAGIPVLDCSDARFFSDGMGRPDVRNQPACRHAGSCRTKRCDPDRETSTRLLRQVGSSFLGTDQPRLFLLERRGDDRSRRRGHVRSFGWSFLYYYARKSRFGEPRFSGFGGVQNFQSNFQRDGRLVLLSVSHHRGLRGH